jgi:formate dehydrogenase subunit gamma
MSEQRDEIVRYEAGTRVSHWIVAISFVLLALSGLAIFYPPLFWLSDLFGGGALNRAIHPWIGVVMAIAFVPLAGSLWRQMSPSGSDRQWLRQIGDVIGNHEDKLPEVGRYNAGQKLIFYVMLTCVTLLLLSGLVIWRAYFTAYFPIGVARLASLTHAFFGFVAIASLIVHIYAGIWVKGSVRAMTRGTVSYGWAWKHHRAWFREMTGASSRK